MEIGVDGRACYSRRRRPREARRVKHAREPESAGRGLRQSQRAATATHAVADEWRALANVAVASRAGAATARRAAKWPEPHDCKRLFAAAIECHAHRACPYR